MKVEVKDKVSEIKFPCLMVTEEYDVIVLFTSSTKGICVMSDHPNFKVGEYSNGWVIENFKLFDGEITLKND